MSMASFERRNRKALEEERQRQRSRVWLVSRDLAILPIKGTFELNCQCGPACLKVGHIDLVPEAPEVVEASEPAAEQPPAEELQPPPGLDVPEEPEEKPVLAQKNRRIVTDRERQRAMRLRSEGWTRERIASALDRNQTVISRMLRKGKVDAPSKPTREPEKESRPPVRFEKFMRQSARGFVVDPTPLASVYSEGGIVRLNDSAVALFKTQPCYVDLLFDREAEVIAFQGKPDMGPNGYKLGRMQGKGWTVHLRGFVRFFELDLKKGHRRVESIGPDMIGFPVRAREVTPA